MIFYIKNLIKLMFIILSKKNSEKNRVVENTLKHVSLESASSGSPTVTPPLYFMVIVYFFFTLN